MENESAVPFFEAGFDFSPIVKNSSGELFATLQMGGGIVERVLNDLNFEKIDANGQLPPAFIGWKFEGDFYTRAGNYVATGKWQFRAIEYWPYDPNDGLGPIYDSTTGEQLRPFPA